MSIEDLIAQVNDRLTPTERRIAAAFADDPALLAFGTVADIAGRVGTSSPSIVRFAAKLGFDGFRDLQQQVRDGLSERLIRPSARIRRPQGSMAPTRQAILDAVDATFEALDETKLNDLATPIARARNVWILSGETSRAGGHSLTSGLSMIRPGVTFVEEHRTGRDLTGAGQDDVVVVFDFERYRRNSIVAARTLSELGVAIVAITDGPLSPLAAFTQNWCGLRIPAVGPFDSSVPAVVAAELIVSHVARLLGEDARQRIDQLEAMWESTGTFLTYRPRTNGSG